MAINVEGIPQEMKDLPNWVCWRFETSDGRKTKIPYNPKTGGRAKANDPTTWVTYEEAAQSLGRYDGIGFQLSESPFVGIDMDHVLTNGRANPQAQEVIEQFDTYTEISPSGSGIHCIVRADILGKGYRNDLLELYSQARYLTVTGNIYQRREQIAECTDKVKSLIQAIDAEREAKRNAKKQAGRAASPTPAKGADSHLPTERIAQTTRENAAFCSIPAVDMTIPAIIERIRHSKQAELFSRLFDNGDISAYESPSSADQALMNILPFHTGGNIPLMIEIFSQSALAKRDKWQNRPDYQMRTAQAAIDSWNGQIYDPQAKKKQRLEQDRFIREYGIDKPLDELKKLVGFERNDTGNAERLEFVYGDSLRYCTAAGRWLVWDGKRWREESSRDGTELYNRVSAVMRLSYLLYDEVYGPPTNESEEERKKAFFNFCSRSQNKKGISDAIARARALLPIDVDKLDANPWLLNCQNGVVDLKTGQILPHDRKYFITQICAASYQPGTHSQLWETTVQQIIPDPNVREYLHRFIGYCLTGLTREEKFLFLYGAGGGGKGTFIETIGKIMGDYADTVPIDILLSARNDAGSGNEPSPQIAKIKGKRLVLTSESGAGRKFNDAKIKLFTGSDQITARFLRRDPFTFMPAFKIVMASNFLPAVTNTTDKGMRRRLVIVPFAAQLDDIRDITLKEKLLSPQEKKGILSWCIGGCLKWQREGLGDMPTSIKRMLQDYYDENDLVGEFLEQYCDVGDGLKVKARTLLRAFNETMGDGPGWHGVKRATFTAEMKNRGFYIHKFESGQHFMGVSIKDEYRYLNHA